MYIEHSLFEPPKHKAKIWRYLDFTKYLSLIENRALFFCRSDKLPDPFEGSIPYKNHILREEQLDDLKDNKIPQDISTSFEYLKKYMFINCWTISSVESAAMWKLYLRSNEGIAIQSTFDRLTACFDNCDKMIRIGKVKYLDYQEEQMPLDSRFQLYLHKRKSFQHEHELRAIHYDAESLSNNTEIIDGILMPVNLDILIEKIYVAPEAPFWFKKLVESVSKRYGINKIIVSSQLDERPLY